MCIEPPNRKVETICLNCIFATWENKISSEANHENNSVRYQTGCKLDLLNRFKDRGVEIDEYVDDKSGAEFYSIVDRVCVYNRPKKWARQFKQDVDLQAEARKEVQVRTTVLIYYKENLEQLIETLNSINNSTLKPKHIIVIFDQTTLKPSMIYPIMEEHCVIPWRIEFTTNTPDMSSGMNFASKKTKSTFMIFIDAGDILPKHFIEDLDIAINDKLEQILLIEPKEADSLSGTTIHNALIRQLGVPHGSNIIETIKRIIGLQECPHLIK